MNLKLRYLQKINKDTTFTVLVDALNVRQNHDLNAKK